MIRMSRTGLLVLVVFGVLCGPRAAAQNEAALVRLLKSGKLPSERVPAVLNLLCQRGTEEDLAYVYSQAVKPDGFSGNLRRQALAGLAAAAQTRKVVPKGVALDGLALLVKDRDPATQRAALRLAAAWKAAPLAPAASRLLLAGETSDDSRRAALETLAAIGGEPAKAAADKLLAADQTRQRAMGVALLAGLDVEDAAQQAARLLADPACDGGTVDVLLSGFLARQGGTDRLAEALRGASIGADPARLALRQLYLAGHSDATLVEVLTAAAGINAQTEPPSQEELQKLAAEVRAKGDAARGELVFRRGDLGCMKCHSVSGAGGDVGPDLSPLGATSPVDYCLTSVLQPDLSIKENFLTRNFVTSSGMIHQGIVVDRDDRRVIIKDGTGNRTTIATADIDDESEGKSLMPKGLAAFMTHAELVDVARFLSELGKPGPYAVRSAPTIQRWRYLKSTPRELAERLPDAAALAHYAPAADENLWLPAYGRVAGNLPLAELASDDRKVLYLRGEVDVTEPGEIEIKLDAPDAVTVWIDDRRLPADSPPVARLERGIHAITLRIDTAKITSGELRVIVDKPAGSTAVYTVVGGR